MLVFPLREDHFWLTGVRFRDFHDKIARTVPENLQLLFGQLELRDAALQADLQPREYPNDRHVYTLEAWEVNCDFAVEHVFVIGAFLHEMSSDRQAI